MEKDIKDGESSKSKYIEKQKAEIEKWNDELKELETKLTDAKIDAKAKQEHKDHVQALRQKCDAAKDKLSEIQSSDNETWEDLKSGLEGIWTNVSDGFKKVKSRFM